MKKRILIIIGIIIAGFGTVNVGAENLFGKSGFDVLDEESKIRILEEEYKDGKLIKDSTDTDLIYKMYNIKNTDHYGVSLFQDYTGDFEEQIYYDDFQLIIPVTENGEVKEELWINNLEAKDDLIGDTFLVQNGLGFAMIYPVERINEYDIGNIEFVYSFYIVTPSMTAGIYARTDKGEYIIPVRSEVGKYHNKYNDDKISLELLNVYTADEFVELYRKEREGRELFETELKERQEKRNGDRIYTYYDEEEGDAVTVKEIIDKETGEIKQERVDYTTVPEEKKKEENIEKDKEKTIQINDDEEKKDIKIESEKKTEELNVRTEELSTEQKADELNRAELLKGTENGYELDKTFTRAEAATMLVRLLGKEDEALSYEYGEQFEDVPSEAWEFKYVMYAYNNNIIKGTSETTYHPERDITAQEFLALLLRALGKTETAPENSVAVALEEKIIDEEQKEEIEAFNNFYRRQMVDIAYTVADLKTE